MVVIPDKTHLNILFISGQSDAINEIKDYLTTSDQLDYNVVHRPDFFGSTDLLSSEDSQIDVILLDMALFGSDHSREIFQRMLAIAQGIPIIVFTDEKDEDMAVLAIAEGAAGSITRGKFGLDILKFHDVVAFAAAQETAEKSHVDENSLTNARHIEMVERLNRRGDENIVQAVREISGALHSVEFRNAILLAKYKEKAADI
jgi:DNA-binding NarL/FixJ family response regulator